MYGSIPTTHELLNTCEYSPPPRFEEAQLKNKHLSISIKRIENKNWHHIQELITINNLAKKFVNLKLGQSLRFIRLIFELILETIVSKYYSVKIIV